MTATTHRILVRDRMPSKEKAKAIIVEIIRQAGGTFSNKTNLFKAFWSAHVEFAKTHIGALSNWPIVRMRHGPGIDRFNELLAELIGNEIVSVEDAKTRRGFAGLQFKLLKSTPHEPKLERDEIAAIKTAVDHVDGKSAAHVSKWSHERSRAWRDATNGQPLDVRLDAMPDDLHRFITRRTKELSSVMKKVTRRTTGSSR